MFTKQRHMSRFAWTGLALLAVVPATGRSEIIVLRNEAPMTVVVQVTAAFRGNVRRLSPITVNPRSDATINLVGNKHIVIYDAAVTTRILYRHTIPGNQVNKAFAIKPNPPVRVRLQQIPFPPPGWTGR